MNIQDKINQAEFPIVVTASAGTGKTYSLVNKVKYCVEQGVNPVNMLIFTFTVDAANELKKRVPNGSLMTIGTIHSVMYSIIREHSPKRYFVLDNGAQMKFVMDLFKELKIDFDCLGKYLGLVGMAKNTYTDYYELLQHSPQLLEEFFGNSKVLNFAMEYEKKKEHNHKIDFDDMTLKAYELLSNNPNILDNRQERWKYIFVDEAQDLCPPQIDIINLLAEKYKNLFIVGDEKQAIYASFRASTAEFLKNFKIKYPNAVEFNLPTTYRCAETICGAGNIIASKIDNTVINTASRKQGHIRFDMEFETQRDEATAVCKKAIEEFGNDKEVKILYRTNAQSLTYQQILLSQNIPFSINQANSIFYTKEAKVALACVNMKYEYAGMDYVERATTLNALRPLLKNKWGLYEITGRMKKEKKCPFDNPEYFMDGKCRDTLDELTFYWREAKAMRSISDIFNSVADWIEQLDDVFSPTAIDNLIGIAEFAAPCQSVSQLNELIAIIQKPRMLNPGERAISLSTIHGAKGLEADIVFLTGVVDNLLPHKLGLPQEEMNLFYVGVTRAREDLYISGFHSFGKNTYDTHSYVSIIRKEE